MKVVINLWKNLFMIELNEQNVTIVYEVMIYLARAISEKKNVLQNGKEARQDDLDLCLLTLMG